MKKNVSRHMLTAIVALSAAVALPSLAMAKVSGACGDCHTMHNSQDGAAMASTGVFGTSTPADDSANGALLRYGCVGCHTGDNSGGDVPFVLASTAPTYGTNTLAGGNFYWVTTTDNTGHNVLDVANGDGALGDTPPGGAALTSQLTCAGTMGCHGDRSEEDQFGAVAGGHHGPGNAATNGYVSGSGTDMSDAFRMLAGIEGIEDADWEYTADVATGDHNLYKGASRTDETDDATTISSLCAQCHGEFHNGVGNVSSATFGSPWVRHPTDFDMSALATTSEYAGYTDYSLEAPVAVDTMDGSTDLTAINHAGGLGDAAKTGDSIVTCVSCHRAHGSPYADLLRWDYSTMDAHNGTTGNTGCFNCHTTKDDA